MTPRAFGPRAALAVVFIAPPAAALAYVLAFGVNGASWDHLFDTEVFRRYYDGGLSFSFLFSPHNEHRRAVHRLTVLALGLLTRWNNVAELVFDWTLLVITAVVLYRAVPRQVSRLAFLPIVVMLFNLRQHQAFLTADTISTFLGLTFSILAIAILFEGWIGAAFVCAILATFSHANGLLLWPIGALMLWMDRERRGRVAVLAWTAAGIAITAAYLTNLRPGTPSSASPASAMVLLRAVPYLLVELGGIFTPTLWLAWIAGAIVCALAAAAAWMVAFDRARGRVALGAWILLFGLGAAGLIAVGRSKYPIQQALESRYVVFTGLVVIGVYVAALAYDSPLARRVRIAAVLASVLGIAPAAADALHAGPIARNDRRLDAWALYTAKYQSDETLARLFPSVAEGRAHAAVLERLGLNVFADPHPQPERLARTNTGPLYWIDTVNNAPRVPGAITRVGGDQTVSISGWAVDGGARAAAPAVFGVIDGNLRVLAFCGMDRPDVMGVAGPRARASGFVLTFSSRILSPGRHTVTLDIVAADGQRVFPTSAVAELERE